MLFCAYWAEDFPHAVTILDGHQEHSWYFDLWSVRLYVDRSVGHQLIRCSQATLLSVSPLFNIEHIPDPTADLTLPDRPHLFSRY